MIITKVIWTLVILMLSSIAYIKISNKDASKMKWFDSIVVIVFLVCAALLPIMLIVAVWI